MFKKSLLGLMVCSLCFVGNSFALEGDHEGEFDDEFEEELSLSGSISEALAQKAIDNCVCDDKTEKCLKKQLVKIKSAINAAKLLNKYLEIKKGELYSEAKALVEDYQIECEDSLEEDEEFGEDEDPSEEL